MSDIRLPISQDLWADGSHGDHCGRRNDKVGQGTDAPPDFPSIEQFLAAPIEDVRQVAPRTLIFGTGGTRRRALLNGLEMSADQYIAWTRSQALAAVETLFDHGVHHVFVPVLVDGNYSETTLGYREHLMEWMVEGLAGTASIAKYVDSGWQVRLIGAEHVPELSQSAQRLVRLTPRRDQQCVWFTVAPSSEHAWDLLFEKIKSHQAFTHAEAVRAVYGQDIPTDDVLLLDFGKPQVFTSAVPPLLICKMHCYWRQTLGYALSSQQLRTIIHDFAYQRRTWQQDKRDRSKAAAAFREVWEHDPPTLGVGTRLGPFWYPKTDGTSPNG